MRHCLLLSILFFAAPSIKMMGGEVDSTARASRPTLAETVVEEVIKHAPEHGGRVEDYRADLYVKGRMYVRKKNALLRYVPAMFRMKKGVREYLVESYSDLHYSAPNIYDQKVKAVYGTVNRFGGVGGDVLENFHVNVYAPFLLGNKLLSPIAPNAQKYYTYRIDSVRTIDEREEYYIRFIPKNKSYQLVKGYMIVSGDVWSIRELQFSGRSEYLRFDNLIRMGEVDSASEFLPVRYDFNTTFRFLGSVVDGSYTAVLNYRSIEFDENEGFFSLGRGVRYDLTGAYTLQSDTTRQSTDSVVFSRLRPMPLSENERKIYRNYYQHRDTTTKEVEVSPKKEFWGSIGDMLISDYTLNLDAIGSVKCSPLINPLLLSYSGRDGLSYKQIFKYSRLFEGDRLLRIAPRIGYNFKHKEFYGKVDMNFDYWPKKRASIYLSVGNGNRIYTSEVLDEIKQIPDTIFDFSKIHLNYFKDFYIDLRHHLEIVNGLAVDVGISMHRRTAGQKSDFTPVDPSIDEDERDAISKFRNRYISFAPRVVLSWTPGQYYYMNGDRKINLHSRFPTLSVDWERGVRGVFGSTGLYERWEFDLQHHLPLGFMRNLYYRAGVGVFTNQEELYFVDFVNFTRNNLPTDWNDEIGGVFQLLDRRWYNASHKYIRGHITYEAPFLLLPSLLRYTPNVLRERVYGSVLLMPHLNPYIELGYGIGTHIFDLGVFVSNINGRFGDVGFKITLELFNK